MSRVLHDKLKSLHTLLHEQDKLNTEIDQLKSEIEQLIITEKLVNKQFVLGNRKVVYQQTHTKENFYRSSNYIHDYDIYFSTKLYVPK